MMTDFCQISSLWQTLLLVLSQLTLVSLTAGLILLLRRGYRLPGQLAMGGVLALNAVLYVLMQLSSRLTGTGTGVTLRVPYGILLAVTALSLAFCGWLLRHEIQNRRSISQSSIKEAFDNLPTGVCFFNEAGLPVLCNLAMHRFSFAVCGRDVQFITELDTCLAEDFTPVAGTKKDGRSFLLEDGTVWQLKKRAVTHENGETYTQFLALDVTDLYGKRSELLRETEQLRKVQADLQRLSANVVAVTREEEILNTKMRVHDEMGRCLLAARTYLKEGGRDSVPDSLAASWQRAVSMLKYSNDTPDEDMLSQIRQTCAFVRLEFIQRGDLPSGEDTAYLLTCAVRECVTNAVRYADATELYADFSEDTHTASVAVTNNGRAPEREITEGGGLSTLRRRVERAGGTMTVESLPRFRLTVTVPKRKEDIL